MTTMKAAESSQEMLKRQVCVTTGMGLHARPAARLAEEAQKFSSDILLAAGEQEVDAKSILDILTLAAAEGVTLEIRVRGNDAAMALDHISDLFHRKFEDG